MTETNHSDSPTPAKKPEPAKKTDMKTLFQDNRVKAIAGIAAIAVIWAIMAQSNAGSRQEQVDRLEEQLASAEQDNSQMSQRIAEIEEAETNLAALQEEMASLEAQQ